MVGNYSPYLNIQIKVFTIMTYLAQKPAVLLVNRERPLITIEFAPDFHPDETEYSYEHPRFVFGDRVILKNEYPQIKYVVVGMELIELKTQLGRLLSQPYWKYKITNGEVSYQKEESALVRPESPLVNRTCKGCQHFQDYQEAEFFEIDGDKIANNNYGKGWCNCFNHQSRTHHQMTNDCNQNGSLDTPEDATPTEIIELDRDGYPIEANSSNSTFQVGSIVKIIDPEEHHSEWGVFEIVKVLHNDDYFNSVENYLNSSQWHYKLISYEQGDEAIWVGDGEICTANMSHNICTKFVF